ncbi:hypothetical protein DACRYDRAFT_24309 [Dacryopinax primogenitus]|uniref:Extracellular membrane protein CFEM domain-containing protein n=1 Tax=Dacryopinax primogenitus (strain DJM 731) TaxID=1858805 RepID=M5FPS0_DACPD|nr:uncharacterized protein DACRYDRAFT_24309 [Dacryopinax primogenitus]EJT98735.1 hypothetical protein DACRYDRAFT_24309 [Dacryopinax primogenitus]
MHFSLALFLLPHLAVASPISHPDARQASSACSWQCSLSSDTAPVSQLAACTSTSASCICAPLAALSPTCLTCHLTALSLTYDNYLTTCVYPSDSLASVASTATAKITGTGNVVLGANVTSGSSEPTSLAKSGAQSVRPAVALGALVLVGGAIALLA